MAIDKSGGGVTVIYKCPKCGVYFQAYSKAFRHLKVKHDFKVKSVESVIFQRCNIPIERLEERSRDNNDDNHNDNDNHDQLSSSSNKAEAANSEDVAVADPPKLKKDKVTNKTNKKRKVLNNAAIKKRQGGRVEIKLDDLKASEIETLMMEDLFRTKTSRTGTTKTRAINEQIIVTTDDDENSPNNASPEDTDCEGQNKEEDDECQINGDVNNEGAKRRSSPKNGISRTPRNKRKVRYHEDDEEDPSDPKSLPLSTPIPSSNKRRKRKGSASSDSEDSDYRYYRIEGDNDMSSSSEEQGSDSDESEEGQGDPATTTTIRVRKPRPAKDPSQFQYFQCRLCPETFDEEPNFLKHMQTTHLHNGVYTCPKDACKKTFDNLRAFHIHCHYHVPRRRNEPNKTPKKKGRKRGQSEYKFSCPICAKPCRDVTQLKRHQGVHKQRKQRRPPIPGKAYPFSCPLCESSYEFLTRLREHFIIHLENNPFICKMSGCGYRFSNRKSFKSHVDLHIGKRHFKCDKCEFAFARRTSLAYHIKHYHGKDGKKKHAPTKQLFYVQPVKVEVDFPEGDKDKSTPANPNDKDKQGTEDEVRVKEEEDLWRIEVGSQHFDDTQLTRKTNSSSESTRSHENETASNLSDNEEQDHEILTEMAAPEYFNNLNLRSITLKDPVYLKLLEENPQAAEQVITKKDRVCNLDPEIFKCPVCGWEAIRRFNLDMHMKRFHNQDGTQPMVVTATASSLTPTSTGSVPSEPSSTTVRLLCSQCGYPSTSSDDLAEHMSKEHPARRGNHGCKYCGRYFKDTETLKSHEKRVHFAEKKYSCPQCPAKYATRTALDYHLNTKHSTTGYICTTCKKKFANPSELRAHRKTHSKRERVTCKFCGASSVDKYSLERHIRIVHLGVKAKDLGRKTQVVGEHSNPTRTPPTQIPIPIPQGDNEKDQDQHQDGDSDQILGL